MNEFPPKLAAALMRAKIRGTHINCSNCKLFTGYDCSRYPGGRWANGTAPNWRNQSTEPPSFGRHWAWCDDFDPNGK